MCSEQPCHAELDGGKVTARLQGDQTDHHGGDSGRQADEGQGKAGVCGSDGRTYSNECFLENKACRTGLKLRVIAKGQCVKGKVYIVLACENLSLK